MLKRIFEYLKLGTFASCISENKSAVLFLLLPLDSNGVRLCIFLIYKLKAHNTGKMKRHPALHTEVLRLALSEILKTVDYFVIYCNASAWLK